MKRLPPRKALQVAQLRCDAAVTITITGNAGSGKSTAAEAIARALSNRGLTAALIEADDSISHHSPVTTLKEVENLDDRLFLVVVEDSKIAFKREEKPEEAEAEKECDGDSEECESEDHAIPPFLKMFLTLAAMDRAIKSRQ